MKNKKFLSLAFAIALLVSMVPNSFAALTDTLDFSGTVTGGRAITVSAGDPVTMSVDPSNATYVDNDDTSTLTVSSNDPTNGFKVTVALIGGDTGATVNTLGIASSATVLNGTTGSIKFKAAAGTLVGDGTYQDGTTNFIAYTTGGNIYNDTGTDSQVDGATITISHELTASVAEVPGTYVGQATYTIASAV